MTAGAKADLNTAREDLESLNKQLEELTELKENEQKELEEKWARVVDDETEVPVNTTRSNIYIDFFGVAWVPYYQAEFGGQTVEIPAYHRE